MPRARRTRSDSGRSPTAAELEAYAVSYLARFDCTVARLRQVLARKLTTSEQRTSSPDTEQPLSSSGSETPDIERILSRFQEVGYLDDGRFARALARGLLSRGTAPRRVVERLKQRGVGAALAQDVVRQLADDGETELAAAQRMVRRKRFGWCRSEETRKERSAKDLAALARAGFSFDVAKRALAAPAEEDT